MENKEILIIENGLYKKAIEKIKKEKTKILTDKEYIEYLKFVETLERYINGI